MATAFGLMCCPSTLVPESTLSHIVEAHPGLVPKPCHHRGKTTLATLAKKPSCALKNRLRHRNYQPVCKIVF